MGEVAITVGVKGGERLALLRPLQMGPFKLSHRVVLAPLTRCRSYGNVPQPHAAIYYSQRATPGGLLIVEGTVISPSARCFSNIPGLWTQEQVEGWKPTVKAVKDKGATIFVQLVHGGRSTHTSYMPDGEKPLSSTGRRISTGTIPDADGFGEQPYSEPRAATKEDMAGLVKDFVQASKSALAAGFDGVELHGAHGYLLDQFLKSAVNDRTDEYGGNVENRCRFVLEVVDAVVEAVGRERTAVRLSPFTSFNEAFDEDPMALGLYMAQELNKRQIAYVHYVQPRWNANEPQDAHPDHTLWPFRRAFDGVFLVAGGYTRESGDAAVRDGLCDAVVYGRHFLANPDLPRRFELDAPLNPYDRATFYTSDPVVGYTDYPFLEESHPEFLKAHN